MTWILVKDEIPPKQTKVLGYIRDITEEESYYIMVVACLRLKDGGHIFVDFCGIGNMGHNVVAWMSLPESPEI